jgi:[acyl-carrier-protein] S-malonyltransferase
VAYLFPGQGSQQPGMGRELAEAFPESREVFEAADRVLGRPLARLCFEGSAEELARTENTQPAILTTCVAALRALERRAPAPVAAAGHSLGEYAAHVAAGTLEFADALRIVSERGRLMQQAVPMGVGAMAAVLGLDAARVAEICQRAAAGEVVSPANLNGPAQIVVAGHAAAVRRAAALAREAGARRVVDLPVSAPFHCALMRPAADALRPLLEATTFRAPAFDVYCNVDGAPVRDARAARDALVRQIDGAVRWHETVEALLAAGISTFVEVGPGQVLSGLVRGIRRSATTLQVGDPGGLAISVEALAA